MFTYIALAIVVFGAALVQSTSGFGFGIIFMAIMPLILPYKECNVLTLATVLVLQVYTVIKFRKHINFKLVIVPAIAALIFGSIGVHLMISINARLMDFVLGGFLWILAFYLIILANRIHLKKNTITGFCAGAFGGFMDGMFAIGGPPMVAYFDSVMNDPMEYQATLQTYFMITTVNVLVNNILYGNFTSKYAWPLVISIISCLAGTTLGMHFTQKISMKFVRKLAYTVMVLAGAYHIFKGIFF
ncbi:sulfite exporter TauE/SafE family protein [Ligilactobacillus sp. LYQ135]